MTPYLNSLLEELEECGHPSSGEWWTGSETFPPFLLDRQTAIENLACLLASQPPLSPADLARLEAIRQDGLTLAALVRRHREGLISDLASTAREKSFVDCLAELAKHSAFTSKIEL
jgi:hypothetical protein